MMSTLSKNQLLRVGGCVRNKLLLQFSHSLLLLILKSPLCKLHVRTLHVSLHHPGVSTLLEILAKNPHIHGLKNYLKHISRSCPLCQRAYARPSNQKMGLLPSLHTTLWLRPLTELVLTLPDPSWFTVGTQGSLKVYAVVFVCFITRAVHLELCSDLLPGQLTQILCSTRHSLTHILR